MCETPIPGTITWLSGKALAPSLSVSGGELGIFTQLSCKEARSGTRLHLQCILAQLTSGVVVMGVAGSGKSTLGREVAERMGWPMIEGDDFHSDENKARMRTGVALSDADRAGWLRSLARELQRHPDGAVLTCSALKRSYRDLLRGGSRQLVFVFLDVSLEEALRRVGTRGQHFFSPQLMQSQFETLEAPVNEPGVLRLDAGLPLPELVDQTVAWLTTNSGFPV